jgi:hypothetical protein
MGEMVFEQLMAEAAVKKDKVKDDKKAKKDKKEQTASEVPK